MYGTAYILLCIKRVWRNTVLLLPGMVEPHILPKLNGRIALGVKRVNKVYTVNSTDLKTLIFLIPLTGLELTTILLL